MRRRPLLAGLAAATAASPLGAQPAEVDLLLALAVDASGSIDPDEFQLQREGYAEALTHPAVLAAIRGKPRGAIAVAMVEWGSPGGAATVVEWMRLGDGASAFGVPDPGQGFDPADLNLPKGFDKFLGGR